MKKIIGVILSGGVGNRFKNDIPKQFIKLAGKTILEYTLNVFDKNKNITEIVIVVNKNYINKTEELLLKNEYKKPIKVIIGGGSRQESSLSAIESLDGDIKDSDFILFHDAVRPFITNEIIDEVIEELENVNAVDVATKTTDTIIKVNQQDEIVSIPHRDDLRSGQTPQGFAYGTIKKAHHIALDGKYNKATDDCGLILKFLPDEEIKVVLGSEKNLKITYPLDIYIANHLVQLGYDIKNINLNNYKENNSVTVIFGHSSGIGYEIFNELKTKKQKVYGFSKSTGIDIISNKSIKDALSSVYKKEGRIDNVIVTAGILIKERLENMSDEQIENQISTNYIGSVLISKNSTKYLKETRGHLLLFGSSSYSRGRAYYSIYSSTKAALNNFTQALSEEVYDQGIKVNCLCPERTQTRMRVKNFGNEDKNELLNPKNVAISALNIISTNITGQIIDIKVDDFK